MPAPPQQVIDAILSGSSTITRRCQIFEADGITEWIPETLVTGDEDVAATSYVPRLVAGSVSVDMSRDDRRNLDLTLNNKDGLLKHDPNGFWYDKIIKAFRGVKYANTKTEPKILALGAGDDYLKVAAVINDLGFKDVHFPPSWDVDHDGNVIGLTLNDFIGYDVIVAYVELGLPNGPPWDLVEQAYDLGINIFSIGAYYFPDRLVATSTAKSTPADGVRPRLTVTPSAFGNPFSQFAEYNFGPYFASRLVPATLTGNTLMAATMTADDGTNAIYTFPGVIYQSNVAAGSRWVHYTSTVLDTTVGNPVGVAAAAENRNKLFKSAINWLYDYQKDQSWECQVGEFMISQIMKSRQPQQMRVTCTDYVKKLQGSKFDNAVSWPTGTNVNQLIKDIATNGGITKFKLNSDANLQLDSVQTFDGTTPRWDAIKGICDSMSIEVFFDAYGYLVTRAPFDPLTAVPTLILRAGTGLGNLIDWSETSDETEMYNRVVVSGTSPDDTSAGNIYQGIAENHNPNSPTSIENIGYVKTYYYSSEFFTTNKQCQDQATVLLAVHALESFDLEYESIVFAWLEAGEILERDTPDMDPGVPSQYLSSSFTIPLTIDSMSGSAKRITIVG